MANKTDNREQQLVEQLLGRKTTVPFTVKSRCVDGLPQTIMAKPVIFEKNIYKPFPSFVWLICPRMSLLVAHLEERGLIRYYTEKLHSDKDFRDEYLAGQKEFIELRLAKLDEEGYQDLPEYVREVLANSSVTGSKDFLQVKCLHCHLAQYLAFGNNPVGRKVYEEIGDCREGHEKYLKFQEAKHD